MRGRNHRRINSGWGGYGLCQFLKSYFSEHELDRRKIMMVGKTSNLQLARSVGICDCFIEGFDAADLKGEGPHHSQSDSWQLAA